MKIVIQRVSEASATIDQKIKGQIQKGLMLLIGIENEDSKEDIEWLSKKICNLRIFNDENHVMNLSLKDIDGELLAISQFYTPSIYKKRKSSFLYQSSQTRNSHSHLHGFYQYPRKGASKKHSNRGVWCRHESFID